MQEQHEARRIPLYELLVRQGHFPDQETARRWILAGKVIVNDRRIDKAGTPVPTDAHVRIRGRMKYASRGGEKLEGALAALGIRVEGLVALDCGASTGGFTDCLLQHGASKVYAVDAGFGMLRGRLRADPRVVNLERTNLGDLSPRQFEPRPSLATVDLSYLSLRKALPMLAGLLPPAAEILCLVKPLFEVPDAETRRSGRIRDEGVYAKVLQDIAMCAEGIGLKLLGLTRSPIEGGRGTVEFFLWLRKECG